MKNRFLKIALVFLVLLPCVFAFTACGKIKDVANKTFVFDRVEVTGTVDAKEYENDMKTISFTFDENTVLYADGTLNSDTYDYKFEDGKIYLKSEYDEEYGDYYAVISGKYMIISETTDKGTVKSYFKVK